MPKKSNVQFVRNVRTPKPKVRKPKNATGTKSKNKNDALEGEVWSVRNKVARGHPSLITKRKKNDKVEFIPTTHSPYTFHRKNIRLNKNFDDTDIQDSYILPKIYSGNISELGNHKPNMYPRDNIDKAIIRNMKKNKKR